MPHNNSKIPFWQHFGSKSLKSRRPAQKKSLRRITLQKMSFNRDELSLSASPSEQDFVEMLSKAQCRRYDSQRSPFPSPIITRATPEPAEPDGRVTDDDDDEEEEEEIKILAEDEGDMETPTNSRHTMEEEGEGLVDRESLNSLSNSSSDDCGHVHFLPPGSPAMGMRPNRRSVEALQKLIQANEAPFPLLIIPPDGGYWVQNGEYESSRSEDGTWQAPEIDTEHFRLDTDTTAMMYGRHFVGRSHKNFYVRESKFGPLVFSLMIDSNVSCDPLIRMILRTKDAAHYKVYPSAQLSRKLEPEEYLAIILSTLNDGEPLRVEGLQRIHSKKAPDILQKFDEHSVAKQHKIGVIYQKFGQATEEEMFCNNEHSPAFKEFLELLGETVRLKGFEKYRGGLDNQNDQTGEYSVYTEFQDQEIMFHVSTLLPYDPGDRQQVARKRHIGNDIVLIVFQDRNTPYSPDCVRSRFLHAHIVVQVEQKNTQNTVYKVAVAAKEDVPDFSPPLPTPAVFSKGPDFREWLLTKVLNAEAKCHQASAFLQLATRTRSQLFIHLVKELSGQEIDMTPVHDKRKSSIEPYEQTNPGGSPQKRRMTLGTFFPRRKISTTHSAASTGTGRPLSPNKLSSHRGKVKNILATSTPDLTTIGEDHSSSSSNRVSTLERKRSNNRRMNEKHLAPSSSSSSSSSSKKKFSIRGKRKAKESVTTDNIIEERTREDEDYYNRTQKSDQSTAGFSSDCTSVGSALNWSVPNDLPGVVTSSSLQPAASNDVPSSLENLTFSLDGYHRERWSSNPDIVNEERRRREGRGDRDLLDVVQRVPSSTGPRSCDVAVQVDSMRHVFTFPTPPHSLSPIEGGKRVLSSNRVRMLELQQQRGGVGGGVEMTGSGYYTSSTSTLDTRNSFPFVLEEERASDRQLTPNAETPGSVRYDSDSDDSINDDRSDTTYDSLLGSLKSLTEEVTRLRQMQLYLCKENAKLSGQVKKWKCKYKSLKNDSTKILSPNSDISGPAQQSRKSSEVGTKL